MTYPLVRRLGELLEVKGGKRLPAGTALIGTRTNHPYLRIVDFRDGTIDTSNLSYVPDDVFPQIRNYTIDSGDIYISIVGTVGLVGRIPPPLHRANLTENAAKLFAFSPELDVGYLFQFLRSDAGQSQIKSLTVGSTQPKLALFRIKDIQLPLPPLPEQRAIAATLGALDDKIELNRRMNETLEAMARALFRDWFVDFGPTRAKMAGTAPYLSDDLWSLFPDRLDADGKPEGWEMRRVEQLLELAYGKALKATDRQPGDVPVYGSGGITGSHSEALVSAPSVIVGRKGTVGSLYWEDRPFFPIDTVFYVRPFVPLTFCYYALEQMGLNHMNTDAAVPGLNRNNVYRLETAWSGEALIHAFDNVASVIRVRIKHNSDESRTLAQTRDLLLPRLMSGELRIAQAERTLEEVA